ncbi:MAG: preprotein translocase subunit SecG [Gammaproteobacteria bacterium]|nr:preprotein translocase subunit SecG [Gammaproteobacteria bacterium]
MDTIVLAIYVLVCIGLVGMILIQQGKGADAGANFGGGSSGGASDSLFGSQGSGNFLSKTTAVLATTFFCIALFLSYSSGQKISSNRKSIELPVVQQKSEQGDIPSIPTSEELSNISAETADAAKAAVSSADTPDIPAPAAKTE